MRNTFSYRFYCRKCKEKDGTAPIELALTVNQKRVFVQLPYKCPPTVFNRKRKPQEIERYLNAQRAIIQKVLTELAENGIPLTADTLRLYFRTGGYQSYTANTLFNDYLAIQKKRIGKGISEGTYKKYEYVSNLFFRDFYKEQECTAITNTVVRNFFALIDNKFENSTGCGYKTKFKAIIRFGLDNNKIKINPLQGVKITKEKKPITYLTPEEIEKLKNVKLDNECLERVRDCAIWQISSGLAYADCVSLTPEDLLEKDGVYYIRKRRNKTGNEFVAVILPDGVNIWEKYKGKLPFISNQKYNLFLKAVALHAGINKRTHSHLFRHTYATTLLCSGINIKTVSRCIGDTLAVCNNFYAHLTEETILDEVSKAFEK